MTLRLAPRVERLTAVDVDARMITALTTQVPANVVLVHRDFLDFELDSVADQAPLRVVGNLPYNVSSPILFRLLRMHRERGLFADATLMLQREVADRIRAKPGTRAYGVLAILVGLHADVRQLLALPPGAFRPRPKVHSAVLQLSFRAPAVLVVDEPLFEAMVRSMFTQRRKMLGNALTPFASARGLAALTVLTRAAIDPTRRPETLQLAELARLAEMFGAG